MSYTKVLSQDIEQISELEKANRILRLNNKIHDFYNSIKGSDSFLRDLMFSNSRKDAYLQLMDYHAKLIDYGALNIPKNMIVTKIRRDMGKVEGITLDELEQAKKYITQIAPPEYKNEALARPQSGLESRPKNTSLYTKEEYEQENADAIDLADEVIREWQAFRKKLSTVHFVSLIPQNEFYGGLVTGRAWLYNMRECLDERTKILTNMQWLIHVLDIEFNAKFIGYNFVLRCREDMQLQLDGIIKKSKELISSKQIGNILRLTVKKLHDYFKPYDLPSSQADGFMGVQCPQCNEWRTLRINNPNSKSLRCIDCDNVFLREPPKIDKTMGI